MSIAIIPARGGSKRIPRKNIREFCGKPMIAWSIEAARDSGTFSDIVVSTDDSEIAAIATKYGASLPFERPAELADDFATTLDVMAHAVKSLSATEPVCCIYATAPFVSGSDLRDAGERLTSSGFDYVFSATTFAYPVQRALTLGKGGGVIMLHPEHEMTRSQDLDEAFHDAGQFYWGTATAFREKRPIFSTRSTVQLLPRHRVQDIDTEEDWVLAEAMFKALGMNETSNSPSHANISTNSGET